MTLFIRDFDTSDAMQAFELIKDCFENMKIGGHNSQGIKLQIDGNTPEKLIERAKSVNYVTTLVDNKIVGIGGYYRKKIYNLFVSRKFQKLGIGQKILDEIIKKAKLQNIDSLTTWSTFYANDFYKKNGFKMIKEIYIPDNKKDIVLLEMRKILG